MSDVVTLYRLDAYISYTNFRLSSEPIPRSPNYIVCRLLDEEATIIGHDIAEKQDIYQIDGDYPKQVNLDNKIWFDNHRVALEVAEEKLKELKEQFANDEAVYGRRLDQQPIGIPVKKKWWRF